MKELKKDADAPRWLNTEGTGVPYLHVRIDKTARFYSNYKEYEKNLNLSVDIDTYREVKRTIPDGQVSSLVDNLLKEYFKKQKKEKLIADYKSTARSKEKELEIASLIKKIRPSLVISNNPQNEFDEEIIVVPLSSKELERIRSYELLIKRSKENGLDEDSKILFNRLRAIEKKDRLGDYIGVADKEIMKETKEKLKLVLDLED
ncbi:9072_t:CDS:2 [Ambispora gerdemannii]|uniref:9072_t:CDS:1 n=1 Tax=Ambispora gerdemannii TaxID=144530 RepID=A0A9N8VFQ6_9GLOM|nr:9072_t:CDS:2 [Ambispora gerdemannii]